MIVQYYKQHMYGLKLPDNSLMDRIHKNQYYCKSCMVVSTPGINHHQLDLCPQVLHNLDSSQVSSLYILYYYTHYKGKCIQHSYLYHYLNMYQCHINGNIQFNYMIGNEEQGMDYKQLLLYLWDSILVDNQCKQLCYNKQSNQQGMLYMFHLHYNSLLGTHDSNWNQRTENNPRQQSIPYTCYYLDNNHECIFHISMRYCIGCNLVWAQNNSGRYQQQSHNNPLHILYTLWSYCRQCNPTSSRANIFGLQ